MRSKRNFTITSLILVLALLCGCAATLTGAGTGSRDINAPVEKVFAFFADPEKQATCDPNSQGITGLQGEGLGMTWTTTSKDVFGNKMIGNCVVVGYELNKLLSVSCTSPDGTISGTSSMIFTSTGQGTTRVVQFIEISGQAPLGTRGANRKIIAKTSQILNDMTDSCIEKEFGG